MAIISLTAFCRADPVTNEGSLDTVPAAAGVAVAGAGVSVVVVAAAVEAGAASEAVAGAGVDGAAGLSAGAAAAGADGAAAVLDDVEAAAVAAGAAFGCMGDRVSIVWLVRPRLNACVDAIDRPTHLADHDDHEVFALLEVEALYCLVIR